MIDARTSILEAAPASRRCPTCGASLEARRPQTRSCSASCRVRRWREGQRPPAARIARQLGLPLQDFWGSPPEIVKLGREICAAAGLELAVDLSATAHDRVLPRHIGPDLGVDSLLVPWPLEPGEAGWLNPPYSRAGGGVSAWVDKAIAERALGRPSVLLVNVEPSAAWRPRVLVHADRYLEFTGRLAFIDPITRQPRSGTRHSSALILLHRGLGAEVELVPRPRRLHDGS